MAVRADLAQARQLVMRYGYNSTAYQILNPGIQRWFAADGKAVAGFVDHGRFRVVAGAPICQPSRLDDVLGELGAAAAEDGRHLCYFAASQRLLEAVASGGSGGRLLLGGEPSWQPRSWPEILAHKASLRAQLARARSKGVAVEEWSPERAGSEYSRLHRCLEEWLATRGLPPLHFLVEPETLERLSDRRLFVAEREGLLVGFLVASPIPLRNGWLVEQNLRGHAAPNGTSELLLDAAFRAAAAASITHLSLGLSPLSKQSGLRDPDQPLWQRLLTAWLRAHGARFFNFRGLDTYKAKFLPERWEPLWAVTPGSALGPRALYAIAGVFGSTSPVLLALKGLGRAARQEGQWLERRWRKAWGAQQG